MSQRELQAIRTQCEVISEMAWSIEHHAPHAESDVEEFAVEDMQRLLSVVLHIMERTHAYSG